MKNKLVLIGLLLLSSTPAFARSTFTMPVYATGSTVIQANATGCTVYTTSFYVGDANTYEVSLQASATTLRVPNLAITVEQSFMPPVTEGQADANWATTTTTAVANNYATNSSNWYHQSLTLAPLPWARFKIVGNTGNSTDTTVRMNVTKQYAD